MRDRKIFRLNLRKVRHDYFERIERANLVLIAEIIKSYAAVVYRTTNSGFGEEAKKVTPQRPLQHGFNGKFSTVSYLRSADFISTASSKIRHANQQWSQHSQG